MGVGPHTLLLYESPDLLNTVFWADRIQLWAGNRPALPVCDTQEGRHKLMVHKRGGIATKWVSIAQIHEKIKAPLQDISLTVKKCFFSSG